MFKVFRNPIKVHTPDGYKTAYGIRKIHKPAKRVYFDNEYIDASFNHKFINGATKNDYVRCKDLSIGDVISNKTVTKIEDVGKIYVYDLTDVEGNVYYTNDIISHNCAFLGSSDTLISGEALRDLQNHIAGVTPIPQAVLNHGEMYHKVKEDHSYILSVDPSKDGIDDFSVDVIDVTSFPFEQVFTANLQIDYLMMPEHLNELGNYYNTALIIVENNEGSGQSITDTLWRVYEYENLYSDNNIDGRRGKKKYTGFRTTIKSRPQILNILKIFIDEGKLIINSQTSLNQLYTFTKRKTGNKYEAEDGFKDDAVLSLAIAFAPFVDIKVFDDFELFAKELRIEESNVRTGEYISVLDIGFSNEEDDEDAKAEEMRLLRLEMQGMSEMNDYGLGESF